ncbi:hypothetical protein [Pseudorhodoferax sp. Leaf265]|uniref:hypothetical protein n=1 Tax=Pseudorhodoferax sp. Leaf265 TaxID=1736315 RepID=UPI0012E8838A|nr:hypothetical protein [Pseudorhodoferax sp. Leaf265]
MTKPAKLLTPASFNRWLKANDAELQRLEAMRHAQIVDGVLRQVQRKLSAHGLQGACDVVWNMFRRQPGDARDVVTDTLQSIGWYAPQAVEGKRDSN